MIGFAKSWYKAFENDFYSYNEETQRFFVKLAIVQGVAGLALGGFLVYVHVQEARKRSDIGKYREQRRAENVRKIANLQTHLDQALQEQRKKNADICEKAGEKPEEGTLGALREQWNDPNHVWEL